MEKLQLILKSRTTWTVVLIFLVNGVAAIHSFIPAGIEPLVDGVLSLMAIYFHVNPSQQYTTGSNSTQQ